MTEIAKIGDFPITEVSDSPSPSEPESRSLRMVKAAARETERRTGWRPRIFVIRLHDDMPPTVFEVDK